MPYDIATIDPGVDRWDEQLGTKSKFWFSRDGDSWPFKEARPNTGEDWAEKIASELAHRAEFSAVVVELAVWGTHRGSICRTFRSEGDLLVHGNELLSGAIPAYDVGKRRRQAQHCIGNAVLAMENLGTWATDQFLRQLASYVVLDAFVGNTDRHHQNWGIVVTYNENPSSIAELAQLSVAPSFDHASSLGRELRDEACQRHLTQGTVERYVRRASGGIYLREQSRSAPSPLALVETLTRRFPSMFVEPLNAVCSITPAAIQTVVNDVPDSRMSAVQKEFATTLLMTTQTALRRLI